MCGPQGELPAVKLKLRDRLMNLLKEQDQMGNYSDRDYSAKWNGEDLPKRKLLL
jgi:hypothetical protein